jgi:hypothetical protein
MENPWQELIKSISTDDQTEYGDFKREMDSQLRRLVETSPPMTEQQARALVKIRQEYLWSDHPDEDIENIKRDLHQKITEISQLHSHSPC